MPNENEWSKKNWSSGEIITKDKMNRIEDQIDALTTEITLARNYGSGTTGTLGSRIDNMIICSDNRPDNNSDNELWIQAQSDTIKIPTYDEFQELQNAEAAVENLKINKPLDTKNKPINGTSGQILQTNGDGTTQWVNPNLPTNEQTAQALSTWLIEHPEATTTVEDGSLTETKFTDELQLLTIKDYVTPQMYGAIGDGITDCTSAFQALDGKIAFIPAGTYMVSHVKYGPGTVIYGAGMEKTIIRQIAGITENEGNGWGDLFDFADAHSSHLSNLSLKGQTEETSSNIYRALLKIRTTTDNSLSSYRSVYEHLYIYGAPGSGIVMIGPSTSDSHYQNSANWNYVHYINDIRAEACRKWCMIDETNDSRFSNLYFLAGGDGCLLCNNASGNMYCNLKMEQSKNYGVNWDHGPDGDPYNDNPDIYPEMSPSDSGFNYGAMLLIKNCYYIKFTNLDLQSAYYVGAKIYQSYELNMDGFITNCGVAPRGYTNGTGLLIQESQRCKFNLNFHYKNMPQKYNVIINKGCSYIFVYTNEVYKAINLNACPETCYIIDLADLSHFFNMLKDWHGYNITSYWNSIQKMVNDNTAATNLPVGTRLIEDWTYSDSSKSLPSIIDVVHYNTEDNEITDMTLSWHYSLPYQLEFDAPEAIYYAGTGGLAAGTYHILIEETYSGWKTEEAIQFTLTNALEEGDQIVLDCNNTSSTNPTNGRALKVYAYGSTEEKEITATSNGTEGIELGTIKKFATNGQLNAMTRVIYGYGRWKDSAIRQYLNSSELAGKWWVPKNNWDRPPIYANTHNGFLTGYNRKFVEIIAETTVETFVNYIEYGSNTSQTVITDVTSDKIFLPCLQNYNINSALSSFDTVTKEGDVWDLYNPDDTIPRFVRGGTTYSELEKQALNNQNTDVSVWLRSCGRNTVSGIYQIANTGAISNNAGLANATNCYVGCPSFKIVKQVSQSD